MDKKKLENIRNEYKEFKLDDKVYNFDEAYALLCTFHDDLEYYESAIINEMRYDCKEKKMSEIKNFFSLFTGITYNTNLFDMDLDVLEKHLDLTLEFREHVGSMFSELNDSNSREIYRLCKFTNDKYLSNYNYLEDDRNSIDSLACGFSYTSHRYVNDRDEFKEFFDEEISKFSSKKDVVKTKKM